MHISIHRIDGKTGNYSQHDPGRISVLRERLDPATLFNSGPIPIGMHNPFSIVNPDAICWIEVECDPPPPRTLPKDIHSVAKLSGRDEYESQLAAKWPLWMKFRKGRAGDPLEALVELSFRGGAALFLHITGRVGQSNVIDEVFSVPAICATAGPRGTVYINPKTIVRARLYHSKDRIDHANGFWVAEADDI